MLIAITEFANGGTGSEMPQRVLDLLWEFLDTLPAPDVRSLPEDAQQAQALKTRMKRLALPSPNASVLPETMQGINEKEYRITKGYFSIDGEEMSKVMSGSAALPAIERVRFCFETGVCTMTYQQAGTPHELVIGTDGTWRENRLEGLLSRVLCSGEWLENNTFVLTLRWVEMASPKQLKFTFDGDSLHLHSQEDGPFVPKVDVHAACV